MLCVNVTPWVLFCWIYPGFHHTQKWWKWRYSCILQHYIHKKMMLWPRIYGWLIWFIIGLLSITPVILNFYMSCMTLWPMLHQYTCHYICIWQCFIQYWPGFTCKLGITFLMVIVCYVILSKFLNLFLCSSK